MDKPISWKDPIVYISIGLHLVVFMALVWTFGFFARAAKNNYDNNYDVEGVNMINNLEDPSHNIRKMFPKEITSSESSSKWSAGYFLIAGGASGTSNSTTTTQTIVTFAWENTNGEYVISNLPVNRLRLKFVESLANPKVTFQIKEEARSALSGAYGSYTMKKNYRNDISQFINQNVAYAVIYCKQTDWPVDVKLPLQ